MKIAVTNFAKCSDKSIIASNTLAKYLSAGLDADLFDSPEDFAKWEDNGKAHYDVVVAVNGIPTFCIHRDAMYAFWRDLAAAGTRFYWVGQDYNLKMRPQAGQYHDMTSQDKFKLLGAFEREAWKSYAPSEENYKYFNWNKLTFVEGRLPKLETPPMGENSLLYYGAAREGRMEKFKQYFADPGDLNVHVSVPSYKAQEAISKRIGKLLGYDGWEDEDWINRDPKTRKWLGYDTQVNWLSKFNLANLLDEVGRFAAVLHIEDYDSSHGFYTSPPNRWYEYLSSGTLVMVDKDAAGTIIKSGVPAEDLEPFIVSSPADILEKLKNREELLKFQHERLYLAGNPRRELDSEVLDYFTKEGLI